MGEGDSVRGPGARRAAVREGAAGVLASIIATTIYGALTPATIRTGSVDDMFEAMDTSSVKLPMFVVLLGTLYLGSFLWAVIIERRRPWPFGPFPSFPNPFWREGLPAVFAFGIVVVIAGDVWEATRLYILDDDRFVWVASPAGLAAQWVAAIAVLVFTFVLIMGIAGRRAPRSAILPEPLGR